MASSSITTIPKGLHHLEVLHASKFQGRWPSRLPHPSQTFVPSENRIRRWNIRPGDKVRLMVGKAAEKYFDETKGAKGGWKVHVVKAVDMERNRVYLEGVSNKRSATTKPRPEDYDSLSAEQRATWDNENTVAPATRPVHYSNVQLCVEDNGPNSVFASRITTTQPWFNKTIRRLEWDRFAAKLSGPSSLTPDPERGIVHIPWPDKKIAPKPSPTDLDTATTSSGAHLSIEPTLTLPELSRLLSESSVEELIPASSGARPPSNQTWSNEYLTRDPSASNPPIDTVMPLYLSEELSPRFSRAKRTKGWNDRRQVLLRERDEAARVAVAAWEASGRDRDLSDVLSQVGLEGVTVRGRTRKEVREAALAEFDEANQGVRAEVRDARAKGRVWQEGSDGEGYWVEGERGERLARKQGRKQLRKEKLETRMENLELEPERNVVVPSARA